MGHIFLTSMSFAKNKNSKGSRKAESKIEIMHRRPVYEVNLKFLSNIVISK